MAKLRCKRDERLGLLKLPAGELIDVPDAKLAGLLQAYGGRGRRLVRAGLLEVNPGQAPTLPPPDMPDTLDGLTVEDALVFVRSSDDLTQLGAWNTAEIAGKNRSTLLDRIEARIEELAAG